LMGDRLACIHLSVLSTLIEDIAALPSLR
jgi:hypothetical protein